MAASNPARGDSLVSPYEAFFRLAGFPVKASRQLALAARAKVQAEGGDPDLEEVRDKFVVDARYLVVCSNKEDEDVAILDGLTQLMGDKANDPLPPWVDPSLKGLDWLKLYRRKESRFLAFQNRASKLGLMPPPVELLRGIYDLDEFLLHSVLTDEACARVWKERVTGEKPDRHPWLVHQIVEAGSDIALKKSFCEILADDIRLTGSERDAALADPGRFVMVFMGAHRLPGAQRLAVRRWLDERATWENLHELSDAELLALVKGWADLIVKRVAHPAAAESLMETVRDLSPILQELESRGHEPLIPLCRELLKDPPSEDAYGESWRGAILDLENLLNQSTAQTLSQWARAGGGKAPPIPSPNEWRERIENLDPALSEAMARAIEGDAALLDELHRWFDLVAGERRPAVTSLAARIVDHALRGLGRAGRWEWIEPGLSKLAGESERHARLRQSLKAAVASAASTPGRAECEKFVIRFLKNRDSDPANWAPDLATAFALEADVETEDVLTTPEKSQLCDFGIKFHPGALGRDELVALARRLKATPDTLSALVKYFQSRGEGSEVRIRLARHHVDQSRRLKNDPTTLDTLLRWDHGVSIDFADLLYATGDPRLNPESSCTWPRSWHHLALWHLGAGHGIEEFFKDACHPRHGDHDRPPLGEISPDQVQEWMADLVSEAKNEEAVEVVRKLLIRLTDVLQMARRPEIISHYRLHSAWRRFADEGPYPEGSGLEDFPLRVFPKERLSLIEVLYDRMRRQGTTHPDAWGVFATLATYLAANPAYSNCVQTDIRVRLIEESKKVLMDLRLKAPSATAENEPGPSLYPALAVLCAFKDFPTAIRQLLLIYREIPVASVPATLATHMGPNGRIWFAIPHAVTSLIQDSPPGQREDIRFALADYLQDRLRPRKSAEGKEKFENPDMIEPDPVIRETYVEALADLRFDRGGRIHKQLGNVALHDPEPTVKDAARRCAARARNYGKSGAKGSLGRFILSSWWRIRRGTTSRFGQEFVDVDAARIMKAIEATLLRGESSRMN